MCASGVGNLVGSPEEGCLAWLAYTSYKLIMLSNITWHTPWRGMGGMVRFPFSLKLPVTW